MRSENKAITKNFKQARLTVTNILTYVVTYILTDLLNK